MDDEKSARPAGRARPPGVDVRDGSVRQARTEAGLSLARLAGTEISRGAIFLIETGRSRPSMATLQLISARTGRPLSFFLAPPGDTAPAASAHLAAELRRAEALGSAGRHADAARAARAVLDAQVAGRYVEARAHACLGRAHIGLGQPEAARGHLERARTELDELGDGWSAAECRLLLARAAHAQGEPGAAALTEEAIDACRRLDPVPEPALAAACADLGDLLAAEGRHQDAIDRYTQGLELAPALAAADRLSALYESIGDACSRRRLHLPAEDWWGRAAALRAGHQELGAAGALHARLGAALSAERSGAALSHIREARAVYDRLQLPAGRARALLDEAEWHLAHGEPDFAESLAGEAAEAASLAGTRLVLALASRLLGRLAAGHGDGEERDRRLMAAVRLLEEAGEAEHLVETHVVYAELLEASGQIAEALVEWKRAVGLARPHIAANMSSHSLDIAVHSQYTKDSVQHSA